jgi:hypothetical protein
MYNIVAIVEVGCIIRGLECQQGIQQRIFFRMSRFVSWIDVKLRDETSWVMISEGGNCIRTSHTRLKSSGHGGDIPATDYWCETHNFVHIATKLLATSCLAQLAVHATAEFRLPILALQVTSKSQGKVLFQAKECEENEEKKAIIYRIHPSQQKVFIIGVNCDYIRASLGWRYLYYSLFDFSQATELKEWVRRRFFQSNRPGWQSAAELF